MYPRPQHFIVRPSTGPNKPGPIVPLIAVDQLPDWIQIAGVPLELSAQQTAGLANLGFLTRENDSIYDIRLHTDKIRAIMAPPPETETEPEMEPKVVFKDDRTAARSPSPIRHTPRIRGKAKVNVHSNAPVAGLPPLPIQEPRVHTEQQTAHTDEDKNTKAAIDNAPVDDSMAPHPASGSGLQQTPAPVVVPLPEHDQKPAIQHPAEPMLTASRHAPPPGSSSSFPVTARDSPLRPHITQAMREKGKPIPERREKDKSPAHLDTVYCRHWCQHGTCKWGLQCRYQHSMPTTLEGLHEVGLKDFPVWYKFMMGATGGGGGFGFPGNSNMAMNMGMNTHGLTRQPQPQAHPFMDMRMLQDRFSAMVGGFGGKQKPRQFKEMRDMMRMIKMMGTMPFVTPHTTASNMASTGTMRKEGDGAIDVMAELAKGVGDGDGDGVAQVTQEMELLDLD